MSLWGQHRLTCLTVCADRLPCLSSRSTPLPPARLSNRLLSPLHFVILPSACSCLFLISSLSLPVCQLPAHVWFWLFTFGLFWSPYFKLTTTTTTKKNTNICFLYKLLYFLYNFPTNPNICGLHSHQTQADSTAVRQASDPSPHGRNEHSLVVGSQSQNHGTNATTPNTTRYQTPACCDIPCALIVQHSYDSTSPPKLTPKMRMTTFATSPPTPRLYIQ